MTEKIKMALVQWARSIIKDQSNWDEEKTHDTIQKIYELSIFQKMLIDQEEVDQNLWERHQKNLDEMINSITVDTNKEKTKDDNMEVPPMMETIKNMVTEMPEPETYEKLFESVGTPPTFMSKKNDSVRNKLDTEKNISNDKKNINDQFSKKLSVDNNERLAFIKHLFDGDTTRSVGTFLTKFTSIIAALFIICSIAIVAIFRDELRETQSVLEKQEEENSNLPQIPQSK